MSESTKTVTQWANEYGDIIDASGREEFIDEEMCNLQEATGEISREYAERVFGRMHQAVA